MSNRRPAKLLPVKFNLGTALPADPAGRIYKYNAQLTMTNPQLHSSSIHSNKMYTLEELRSGDYISTTGNGRIMKITSITSVTPNIAQIVVEDDYRLNQIQDSSGDSIPWIESQNGIVFEVIEGKPVLFPYTEYSTSIIGFVRDYAAELFSRFSYLRQDTLVDIYQAGHTFAPGDIITWTQANSWTLMQEDSNYIGIVVEHNEPYAGWFRFRPNGEVLDLALSGTGPYFYWDANNPGKLTENPPLLGERYVLAFYKLSERQVIFFTNNPALDFGSSFVTIGTDQTITGDKTFTGTVDFQGDTSIDDLDVGSITTTGNISVGASLSVTGDLLVGGTTTTINTTNTKITDQLIELNQGYLGPPMSADSGIVINRGPSEDNLFFGWDEDVNKFTVGTGTFDGDNTGELTLTDADVRFAGIQSTSLTDNRIVIVGAGGVLEDDTNLTWDGSQLSVSGTGVAFSTGQVQVGNSNDADIAHTMYVLYNTTTSDSQTELFLDGASQRIGLPSGSTMLFEADIVGRNSSGTDHCSFKITGVLSNTTGTVVLVNNVSETIVAETSEAWQGTVEADDTNDGLAIKVTGEAATDIKWIAFVKTTKISY